MYILFLGINFCPCYKDYHRLYEIINTGQKKKKNCGIYILPIRAGNEKGENFLQIKNFLLYTQLDMADLMDTGSTTNVILLHSNTMYIKQVR